MKDAHEVQQIEPAFAGLRGQPPGGFSGHRLRHSPLLTDFVFVTSSKAAGTNNYGEIDVFEINRESGFMRQIHTSPYPSGGRDPVAEADSQDQYNLYVVNQDDNSIVQFVIGNDGKVYPQNTTNTPGIYPMAVAVNGTNLFVLDTYQPLPVCSTAAPCSGSIGAFPITVGTGANPSDPIGTATANGDLPYWPLCMTGYTFSTVTSTWNCAGAEPDVIVPTAVNVLGSGSYLYVTAYDSTVTPNRGYIFAFAVGSGGALTPVNGGVPHDMWSWWFEALGVHPTAIASDSTSTYVYVTDSINGVVANYSVSSGALTLIGDTPSGNQPSAIVADPAYPYVYVANAVDSTVTAYSISGGLLTSAWGTYASGTDPRGHRHRSALPITSFIPPTILATASTEQSPALSSAPPRERFDQLRELSVYFQRPAHRRRGHFA